MADAATALTIDELARKARMTVRNVRAYRSRGLLPEPEMRGRKGYYGDEHLARLKLISDLRDHGFNLEAIGQIIARAPGDSLTEVLDFTRAVIAPLADEEPRVVSTAVFVERWGDQLTPELVRRAQRLGLVRQVGDDSWEVLSPRLERASIALSELGVPLAAAIELGGVLQRHARAVARAYVELFTEQVWRPFEQAGEPREDWPRVREALDRLQPLAGESLLAVFQLMMRGEVERAVQHELSGMEQQPLASSPAPRKRRRPARPRGFERRPSG
jgi:DNA-binding transcriptional MerR regulator